MNGKLIKNIITAFIIAASTAAVLVCGILYILSEHTEAPAAVVPDGETVWYDNSVQMLYDRKVQAEQEAETEEEYEEYYELPPEQEGLDDLKNSISEYVSSRSGDWGIYVKQLRTNEYLSINEKSYSAASLIKLFTAAAVYNELEAGTFSSDDYELMSNLEHMICESSNRACNYLTRRLGGGSAARGFDVENRCTESLGCVNTSHKSEIVDGSSITVLGRNMTSPRDCGIVLENVFRGTLVSDTASASMLDLLLNQTRRWKIPDSLPEGTKTANKTGETNTAQSDAAIVYSPACSYIICVIGNGNVGSGVDTIRNVSRMVYDYFNPDEPGEDIAEVSENPEENPAETEQPASPEPEV